MKKILTLAFIIILITSCRQEKLSNNDFMMADIAVEEEMIPITKADLNTPSSASLIKAENNKIIKKKIIKDGRLEIEVLNLEKSKHQVDSLLKRYDGYYATERLNNTDWNTSYNLTIRIPSTSFEQLIKEIETGSGIVKHKEISARDVTDQFIDLETRLTNKRSYLKKYNELLKKAKTVKDILEIEEKIRGIEEEIESTTGRLKYLGDLVDYSTLNLEISKPKNNRYELVKRDDFTKQVKHALSKGWYGFIDFVVFLIKIWPFLLITALIVYFWRKYRKQHRNK